MYHLQIPELVKSKEYYQRQRYQKFLRHRPNRLL
jgi:hypothetical protein